MGYSEEDTLFDVLFANKAAKAFGVNDPVIKDFDNSEVFGDARKVVGSDGQEFKGYGFFVQKYLFEEYRQFGNGHGHDLAEFDTYHRVRGLRWPVVNGKETQWRFNTKYDYYAKKAAPNSDYAFYGNQGALNKGDLAGAFPAVEGKEPEKIEITGNDGNPEMITPSEGAEGGDAIDSNCQAEKEEGEFPEWEEQKNSTLFLYFAY